MLRKLLELSVDLTSAAWSIVRRGIAGTMSQAGSAEMCREIRRQTSSGTIVFFICIENLIYIFD
jgi:hypothetical protein